MGIMRAEEHRPGTVCRTCQTDVSSLVSVQMSVDVDCPSLLSYCSSLSLRNTCPINCLSSSSTISSSSSSSLLSLSSSPISITISFIASSIIQSFLTLILHIHHMSTELSPYIWCRMFKSVWCKSFNFFHRKVLVTFGYVTLYWSPCKLNGVELTMGNRKA